MNVDEVIESHRFAVLNRDLQDGQIDACFSNRAVRMTEVTQVSDSRFFHQWQVATVVDDRHRVSLGESDPESMGEFVVSRVNGGI